ncbi:MAG: hypothetical protein Q8R83_01410 [Legionellaceae bacterium]|nr:hypothetical protein [Legionellaceae bacterium]
MPIKIIILSIILIQFHQVFATPRLIDFFNNDTHSSINLVTFLPVMSNEVTGLHLYFLTASDCYSGYAGRFLVDRELTTYPTTENSPFSLSGVTVFTAARSSLENTKVAQINSVLIRLISSERGNPHFNFAYFMGSCQDQDINCCIPVDCSDQTNTCIAKYNLPIQEMYWR